VITRGKHPTDFFRQRLLNHITGGDAVATTTGAIQGGRMCPWQVDIVEVKGRVVGYSLRNASLSASDVEAVERSLAVLLGRGAKFRYHPDEAEPVTTDKFEEALGALETIVAFMEGRGVDPKIGTWALMAEHLRGVLDRIK
jgi:hypothetical protein